MWYWERFDDINMESDAQFEKNESVTVSRKAIRCGYATESKQITHWESANIMKICWKWMQVLVDETDLLAEFYLRSDVQVEQDFL